MKEGVGRKVEGKSIHGFKISLHSFQIPCCDHEIPENELT